MVLKTCIHATFNTRESNLKELLEDAREMNFDESLIQVYTNQLKEVQAEIKSIKESKKKIYTDEGVKQ